MLGVVVLAKMKTTPDQPLVLLFEIPLICETWLQDKPVRLLYTELKNCPYYTRIVMELCT